LDLVFLLVIQRIWRERAAQNDMKVVGKDTYRKRTPGARPLGLKNPR